MRGLGGIQAEAVRTRGRVLCMRRPARGVLLGGVATLLLCGTAAASPSPGGVGRLLAATPSARTGCGKAAAAGSSTLTLTVDGRRRTVIVHLPTRYQRSVATPLVLNMHGSDSTAAQQEALTGMDTTADADGFIVAYPQGLIRSGAGFDWNVPGEPLVGGQAVPRGAPNDVAFLTGVVSVLGQRYCIDVRRVYATGFSGGGRTASQLACDASRTFAAVAPVSGLRHPTPCPTRRAVPVIAFHGTADPVDPYDGHGQAYWTYSVPDAAAMWARQDGCSTTPTTHSGSGYVQSVYDGCAARSSVQLYSITGAGHEWPGGPTLPPAVTRVLGPQSNAVDANATMWAFFESHSMP